jgi:hypothetical protein
MSSFVVTKLLKLLCADCTFRLYYNLYRLQVKKKVCRSWVSKHCLSSNNTIYSDSHFFKVFRDILVCRFYECMEVQHSCFPLNVSVQGTS